MAIETSKQEALADIRDFARHGKRPLLVQAVSEIIAVVTGLDIEIRPPTKEEARPIHTAQENDVSNLLLVYAPGVSEIYYPGRIRERLSIKTLAKLAESSRKVKGGWRIIDVTCRLEGKGGGVPNYENDESFLGRLIQSARQDGDVPMPEDVSLSSISQTSRLGLIPSEIRLVIVPRAESLLKMEPGSMGLVTLREAMLLSSLYGFVGHEVDEWQEGDLLGEGANRLYPAGLVSSHYAERSDAHYYDIRTQSKYLHNSHTGFRLQGRV